MSQPFASRAGGKLYAALKTLQVEVSGAIAADLGSSSGGFVDVLLRSGASRVYAVEKGFGRLEWRLRNDPRVIVMERTDGREVELPELVDLISIDIGFVRQVDILPKALCLVRPGGRIVSLLKPQYEATGRDLVRGRLSDEVSQLVLERTLRQIAELGIHVETVFASAVRGKDAGVQEYFISITRPPEP